MSAQPNAARTAPDCRREVMMSILTKLEEKSMLLAFCRMSPSDQVAIYGLIHDLAAAHAKAKKPELQGSMKSSQKSK